MNSSCIAAFAPFICWTVGWCKNYGPSVLRTSVFIGFTWAVWCCISLVTIMDVLVHDVASSLPHMILFPAKLIFCRSTTPPLCKTTAFWESSRSMGEKDV